MRTLTVFLPILSLVTFCLVAGGWAQNFTAMKATAPDKMMPKNQAEKMRACDKLAMDQNVKMEDRAQFVERCVGGTARRSR